jgi:hypothetical protein
MLPILIRHPELRCTAKSRRSGWQQCGRLAAYGSTKCTTHGARKNPRFGKDAPNYRHGNRSEETVLAGKQAHQRLNHLAMGVELINTIPASAQTALNDAQKADIVQFLVTQAKLNLRQEAELASIEAKKQPRTSRKQTRQRKNLTGD